MESLESKDSRYRYEIRVSDYYTMRRFEITQPSVDNNDVGHFEMILSRMSDGARQHIVTFARLILQAAGEQ